VWLVIGTRPEAIKLAPVASALVGRGIEPLLVFTGQQVLDCGDYGLSGFAQLQLGCRGRPDPHRHVRQVTAALGRHLATSPPQLVVVQGDTSSALGAALGAFTADVPVAHVEAGLRTHDPHLPWPEEDYRIAIDADAELLFAPTELAARNLRCEHVPGEIHVTGNSGIDALLSVEAALPPRALRDGGLARLLVTCHRRESWGEGLASVAAALRELAGSGLARVDLLLHPNRHVAAAMRQQLAGTANLQLIEPCTHPELVRCMRDADLILSDSGGIQEEAPALGTPLLVLRDKTERPEAIDSGNARLVGTDAATIITEVQRLLSDPAALAAMSHCSFPFGDGRAAPRIAKIIDDWLAARRRATSARTSPGHPVRW
jgi:UDP-N-acetylglucosamine 2-epimerase (non-hydrolysing)